jgi:hypothetical protein
MMGSCEGIISSYHHCRGEGEIKMAQRRKELKQEPLVIHVYWRARRSGEPHIGYGSRRQVGSQGMTGLALSGGVFGLFISLEFVLPVLSVLLIWLTFSPLLHDTHGRDTGWYEIDDNGDIIAFIGREPPEYIRGRPGVRLPTFLKQVNFVK